MNKVIIMGRLTRDPDVRNVGNDNLAFARYTLAVDRPVRRSGEEKQTDFINCVAFGKTAEFVEKYLKQGMKMAITGRLQTGSYTNKDGQKVYTTDVVVESHDFCESRAPQSAAQPVQGYSAPQQVAPQAPAQAPVQQAVPQMPQQAYPQPQQAYPQQRGYSVPYAQSTFNDAGGFMNIPDGIDEELPFN